MRLLANGHIREFREQVNKKSELFHPENPSTFVVATLLYQSKYCWFKDDVALEKIQQQARDDEVAQ